MPEEQNRLVTPARQRIIPNGTFRIVSEDKRRDLLSITMQLKDRHDEKS